MLLKHLRHSDPMPSEQWEEVCNEIERRLTELQSSDASGQSQATTLCTQIKSLMDAFNSINCEGAEIYRNQFGTHVSVSWRSAQTEE